MLTQKNTGINRAVPVSCAEIMLYNCAAVMGANDRNRED